MSERSARSAHPAMADALQEPAPISCFLALQPPFADAPPDRFDNPGKDYGRHQDGRSL